jgi:lysophospholipase L1-like esterase
MRASTLALLALAPLSLVFAAPSHAQARLDRQAESALAVKHYRESRLSVYMNDFGELERYCAADLALGPPAAGERRVIYFGDSITDSWPLDQYFPGKGYINRGISGQTTSQMLVRFRQDVIALRPAVVVVLAGTNDIAGNTGPISIADIESNYATLAELASVHRIRLVFSSVMPVHDYTPLSQNFFAQRDPAKVLALNAWLRQYCAQNGLIYLDYFSAMVDAHGLLQQGLSEDGLHPNSAGFHIMAPLAQAAVDKALQ